MNGPLDDVAFLARSENRVAILRALDDRSLDRRAIATETGIPRSTLGRALGDLEECGWVEQNGGAYATTTAGGLVLDRFIPLLQTMAGLRTLGDAVDLLPVEEMSVEIRHFADAKVVTPTELNPTAPYDYGIDRLRKADRVWVVARTVPPSHVTVIHEEVISGRLDATCVLDTTYLDALSADDEVRAQWQDLASGSAVIRSHVGPVPNVVIVLDNTVHLWLCEEGGDTRGLMESENSAVLTWAEATIADYLDESQSLENELAA